MKKCVILTSGLLLLLCLSGCVSRNKLIETQTIIDSLINENNKLINENDKLKNGERRLLNLYKFNVSKGNYILAEENFHNLVKHHPESPSIKLLSLDIDIVLDKAKLQRDSIEKAIKDSIRIANIEELGEWKIGYFIDDFKEPTGKLFVYQTIIGTFSNSATFNSPLRVTMRIYKEKNYIEIKTEHDEYMDGTIDAKDFEWKKNGIVKIVCYSNRKIYFNETGPMVFRDSETREYISLLNILKMGDKLEFSARHGYSTKYKYTVEARYLENALIKAGIENL